MTSASRMSGSQEHPEVTEISDLTEGLLPRDRGAEVRAHLAECELCADVRASLEEIRGALGTLPGPVRMPAEVAGRIDAALAAEALLDAGTPPSPAPGEDDRPEHDRPESGSPERSVDIARRVPRRTTSRTPGDADVSRETGARPGARPAATSPAADRPAGRGPAATGPGRRQGRRRGRLALLSAAGVAAVLGLGGIIGQAMNTGGTGAGDAGAAREASQTDGLERRVQALLDQQEGFAQDSGGAPDMDVKQSPQGDAPLAGGKATVPSCVRDGIGRSEEPLAVDPASPFQGRQAYLVVLPHAGSAQRVDAYVVDAACTTGAEPGPAEVLRKRTYDRD